MIHSTGHKKRLNRFEQYKTHNFGSHDYSKEELVAELGSAYLATIAGIDANIKNASAYINGWSSKPKNNTSWIIWAAAKSEKAANYILKIKPEPTN